MVNEMAEGLMGAEADALCGAGVRRAQPGRVNRRNGYPERDRDTRVGSDAVRSESAFRIGQVTHSCECADASNDAATRRASRVSRGMTNVSY